MSEFVDISPFNDEEAAAALHKIAGSKYIAQASKFVFPEEDAGYLGGILAQIQTVEEFQTLVMQKIIARVLKTTAHTFSYDGISNIINANGKFLAMSNHRDIILDPAIVQLVLFNNGLPLTEICVGSNLISNELIEALIRSNRMIKVVRGISARELYICSQLLSRYIRLKITSGESSVWLAQRQGRTKNGLDMTEQGLLKMLDMSGTSDFKTNFEELNIIPLSISYEYEPCDIAKAREMLISRTQKYVKAPNEDTMSILTGIMQQKGNIHLNIGKPLAPEELAAAALCDKNDRYQAIRHAVDMRIIDGYKLFKNAFVAYDLQFKTNRFKDRYTQEDRDAFIDYMNAQLAKVEPELNHDDLRDIFLGIYCNPIVSKELFGFEV